MQKKYLFLGPKKNVNDPNLTGGVIVLFENLIDYCNEHNIDYEIIDTNKANYNNKLYAYIQILFLVFLKTQKATYISLHGTANDYFFIAPFALVISKLFGKHFSLRKFAGNFIEIYENSSIIKQVIIKIILKYSSCNFFETKYLVEYFKKFNPNTFWFPNVRKKSFYHTDQKFHKRFVYIGAITEEKGIDTLCKASNLLLNDYIIDLYGILGDNYTESYFNKYNVNYQGILDSNNVTRVLSGYDVLILPSLREGYPGVIIEAMSAGLPVIATNLDAVKEMLDDNMDMAFLIVPNNIIELKKAIETFSDDNYLDMSVRSFMKFDNFDSEVRTKLFFKVLNL